LTQVTAKSRKKYFLFMLLLIYTVTAVGVAGSNIQLSCPVLSSSNPSVQWILPDGSKLNTSSSSLDGRFQLSASGLLIQRVQLSDGGLYHCVARAGRDFDVLQLRLAVQESAVPYSGELSGPPVTGTIRDAVTLPCRISGSPEPLASWILPDGNVVWQGLAVSGGLKVHSNGSLSLLASTLKDTGYYRCIAVNQYGSDTMSMQLILKAQHISSLETSLPRGPQSAAVLTIMFIKCMYHVLFKSSKLQLCSSSLLCLWPININKKQSGSKKNPSVAPSL
uniref:Ig-like domain-containing protein n=1 Tax=Poecilia latipinna TaxID=48699 RepID=A0A3B3UW12_9TELE